jgi:hypothetical protein
VLRTTLVLAHHSDHVKQLNDELLNKAMQAVAAGNYDFQRIAKKHMELIYAHFDDETSARVLDEFVFRPRWGHIRDLGACIGVCALCGKGDSKDTGDNEDKIRYEFLLSNTSGGTDVWCGSTCIINHHLKVDGAATSAEARKSLERAFREHKEEWKREVWRQAHPDHVDIPALYEEGCTLPSRIRYNGPLAQAEAEIGLMGISFAELERDVSVFQWRPMGAFRKAVRFYTGSRYLTPRKMPAWVVAKRVVRLVAFIERALLDGQDIDSVDERIAFFRARGEALFEAKRKARALDTEEVDDVAAA